MLLSCPIVWESVVGVEEEGKCIHLTDLEQFCLLLRFPLEMQEKNPRTFCLSLWQSRLNGGVQAKRREISASQVNLVNNEDLVYSKVKNWSSWKVLEKNFPDLCLLINFTFKNLRVKSKCKPVTQLVL